MRFELETIVRDKVEMAKKLEVEKAELRISCIKNLNFVFKILRQS